MQEGTVELSIFDLQGKNITTLYSGSQEAGSYSLTWDGRNNTDKLVSSGIYFLRFTSATYSSTQILVFVR